MSYPGHSWGGVFEEIVLNLYETLCFMLAEFNNLFNYYIYDTKQADGEATVPVRVLSMGQIELLNHLLN